MHWKFFVEMLFMHYSDSEMYWKTFTLYKHTLHCIINNQWSLPARLCFAEHEDGKQVLYQWWLYRVKFWAMDLAGYLKLKILKKFPALQFASLPREAFPLWP